MRALIAIACGLGLAACGGSVNDLTATTGAGDGVNVLLHGSSSGSGSTGGAKHRLQIASLTANTATLYPNSTLILYAVVTDGEGGTVVGGTLLDDVTDTAYGFFSPSESPGTYTIVLDYAAIAQHRTVTAAAGGSERTFRARFYDASNNLAERDVRVVVSCFDASQALCDSYVCTDARFDSTNCGACGVTCASGSCVGGACTAAESVSAAPNPQQLVLGDGFVAFADAYGRIIRVRADGGTAVHSPSSAVFGLAADGADIFWDSSDGLVHQLSDDLLSEAVVLDGGSYLYWLGANGGSLFWSDSNLELHARPEAGGAITDLGTLPYGAVPQFDGDRLFWFDSGHAVLVSVPRTGGAPSVVSSVAGASAVAAADGRLYWFDGLRQELVSSAEDGSGEHAIAAAADPTVAHVFGGALYWLEGNQVRRAPVGGLGDGGFDVLLAGSFGLQFVVAGDGLYYATADGVFRVPR